MSDTAELENLADMSDEGLLAGLERGTIPPADFAAEFRRREFHSPDDCDDYADGHYEAEFRDIDDDLDRDALDEAAARYRRREYRETLWNLEKALGSDFAGLSEIIPDGGLPPGVAPSTRRAVGLAQSEAEK